MPKLALSDARGRIVLPRREAWSAAQRNSGIWLGWFRRPMRRV